MSANNQMLIFKIKNEFCVFENCCVDNDFLKPRNNKRALFKDKSLEKAIKFANRYMLENIVEYGLSIRI